MPPATHRPNATPTPSVGRDEVEMIVCSGPCPIILAEVDDMEMPRLFAREREVVTLISPTLVRDELESGLLVEHCRIPQPTESYYAIILNRRFPNSLLGDLPPREKITGST